jgi:hypothetical protein
MEGIDPMATQSIKHSSQRRPARTFALAPRWQWLTNTVLVLGGGGTTVAALLQEELLLLESLVPLAAIPVLGAPVLWLVRALFNRETR